MQNNIKLKKLIEETFGYKCKEDCKYISASSSEELGKKIREKIESAYKINGYEFTTNSGRRIGGSLSSQSVALKNLSYMITDLKIGYMEIINNNYPDHSVESFAFGNLDPTKECLKSICRQGESKNIELSTYNDFASLQDAVINIIGKTPKCNWHYIILRENENSCGRIEGTDQKRMESENKFFSNFEQYRENILAVSFRELSKDIENYNKEEDLKHYVLFMV